jgi:hypothetical protein
MSARWFRLALDDRRADDGLPVSFPLGLLVAPEEHVALLAFPAGADLVGRKDDLIDDGVAALFGLAGGEAELVGLCFDGGRFTPAQAARWLAGRGFVPRCWPKNANRAVPAAS